MPKKEISRCNICKKRTDGRGHFEFRYGLDTVILCGHHAKKVWDNIQEEIKSHTLNGEEK